MAGKRTRTRRRRGQPSGKKSANLRYTVPTKDTRGGIFPVSGNVRASLESVCALSNPFCTAARGSKIPDDDSAPSVPVTLTSTFEVTTDANGDAAFIVAPHIQNLFYLGTTISGTQVTAWGSAASAKDWAAFSPMADQARIVSMGVRVYSTLSPTEQAGYCRIVTTPEIPSTGVNIDGGLWEAVQTYPMSELDAHVILRPQGVEWKVYHPITSSLDYNYVAGIVKGSAASKTALIVEITMNLECLVNIAQLAGGLTTPGKPSDPHALSAASRVHSRHKGIHNGSTQSVGTKLLGFVKDAALDVAATAIPYFGGSIARMFRGPHQPTIMDVD